MKITITLLIMLVFFTGCAKDRTPIVIKEGMIEFSGSYKVIRGTGIASGAIWMDYFDNLKNVYGFGSIAHVRGEVTIFNSKLYVSKVYDKTVNMYDKTRYKVNDPSFGLQEAYQFVWLQQEEWQDIPIPNTVKTYKDLQLFVKEQAEKAGLDVGKPFAFLMYGMPTEFKWHICSNVYDVKEFPRNTFIISKVQYYTIKEMIDIIGVYAPVDSELYYEQFDLRTFSQVKEDVIMRLHFVSRDSDAAGRLYDLILGPDMVLRLPVRPPVVNPSVKPK
ncbi:MAG: hypothetical protein HQL06_00570 [Nitrospirae bacterium]|nr:hypothetical protein [Nitrospirota bacterium]